MDLEDLEEELGLPLAGDGLDEDVIASVLGDLDFEVDEWQGAEYARSALAFQDDDGDGLDEQVEEWMAYFRALAGSDEDWKEYQEREEDEGSDDAYADFDDPDAWREAAVRQHLFD